MSHSAVAVLILVAVNVGIFAAYARLVADTIRDALEAYPTVEQELINAGVID